MAKGRSGLLGRDLFLKERPYVPQKNFTMHWQRQRRPQDPKRGRNSESAKGRCRTWIVAVLRAKVKLLNVPRGPLHM